MKYPITVVCINYSATCHRYYSASIITMAGIGDPNTAVWIAAGVASFNFIFTFLGLWLVERMGRRPLLLSSLLGSTLALLELSISFHLSYVHSPDVSSQGNATYVASECSVYQYVVNSSVYLKS